MKITAFLLLVGCLHVSAKVSSQTFTYSGKNVPLENVLTALEQQTGYHVFYNYALLDHAQPVTVHLTDAPLTVALSTILNDQPFDYTIVRESIVLSAKSPKPTTSPSPMRDLPPVTGIVRGPDGQPLAGVNVVVKGSKRGTTTDENGRFELNANDGDILLVSSIGYTATEVAIKSSMPITITLERSTSPLDEVQIIAYGQTSKRFQTGNVTSVKAEDIAKQPVNNPLLALEGRVPGLFIEQATGLPGSGVKVRIQGQNSIGNGNDPLYVVDGVPYTSQLLPSINSTLGNSGDSRFVGNPLSYINPADIESIEILKDADATAIYGSRGANGVILITTKKGKVGETRVNLNLQHGWGKVASKMDLLNSRQYLEMRHEALKNDGISAPSPYDYDLNGLWDTTRYTDWQKELIGGAAHYTDLQGSASGGTVNTQYLVGAGYHRENTVFPGDFADQKGSLHFSIGTRSINQKFHLQLTGSYLYDDNHLPPIDLTSDALTLAPVAPALFKEDGSLNWMLDPSGATTFYNPLRYLAADYQNRTSNLIGNLELGYSITNNIQIKSDFGYTNMQMNEVQTSPITSYYPEQRTTTDRVAQYGNNNINSFILEPQLTFNKAVGKGKLDALLGTTLQHMNSNGQLMIGSGYNSDAVLRDIKSAASKTVFSSTYSLYRYNALFGRINYNLREKYIINLTARRDGSSRFGKENQLHNFGAIGGAWLFSEESFIKKEIRFISFGKVRVSYGTTGNDQIGDYAFLNLYTPITSVVGNPYQGILAIQPSRIANPYLEWEETRKLQAGLDVGLLQDRILINTTFFRNRSSNQLLNYRLPSITGFPDVLLNFPATVQNTGWEFSVISENIKRKEFTWTTSVNLTVPGSKLIAFDNIESSSYKAFMQIGMPINITHVSAFAGVDPQTGVYQFFDATGNLTSYPTSSDWTCNLPCF